LASGSVPESFMAFVINPPGLSANNWPRSKEEATVIRVKIKSDRQTVIFKYLNIMRAYRKTYEIPK
jgi:hypothetical protein